MDSDTPVLCVVLGGGGHARVLIDCLWSSGVAIPHAVLDANRTIWGEKLLGVPIPGGDELLPTMLSQGVSCFVVGLGAVGNNEPRRRLFELGCANRLTPLSVRHPSAVCSRWAEIGAGSVLFPVSVINAGAIIGVNVIINTGAIVEHDCVIGDHVHIATGARLASSVRVGTGAHVGAGAIVRQCLSIGEGAIVGAGAAVVDDVRPHAVVVGVPARSIHEVSRVPST